MVHRSRPYSELIREAPPLKGRWIQHWLNISLQHIQANRIWVETGLLKALKNWNVKKKKTLCFLTFYWADILWRGWAVPGARRVDECLEQHKTLHGGWCGYSEQLRPLAAFLSLFPHHSSCLTISHINITGNTCVMPNLGKLEMTEERQREKEKGERCESINETSWGIK